MNIRKVTENDIPQLHRLLQQVLTVHHEGRPDLFKGNCTKYSNEELATLLKDENSPVFGAFDEEGVLLGHAFCVVETYQNHNIMTDRKTLYIDDICVDENARGQHVGKSLYEFVRSYAKENGFYNITLNVWSCNPSAVAFYQAMGLQPYKIGMETIL